MKHPSLARPLAGLRRLGNAEGPTLGQAAQALSGPSALPLLILCAMLGMIPSPGLPIGSMFGGLIVWLALSMLRGAAAVLPDKMSAKRIPRSILTAALRRLIPLLRKLERPTRTRWVWAAAPMPATIACLVLGAVIVLPIPFGNFLPGAAIILLSLSLARRDGKAALLGYILGAAAIGFAGLPAVALIHYLG